MCYVSLIKLPHPFAYVVHFCVRHAPSCQHFENDDTKTPYVGTRVAHAGEEELGSRPAHRHIDGIAHGRVIVIALHGMSKVTELHLTTHTCAHEKNREMTLTTSGLERTNSHVTYTPIVILTTHTPTHSTEVLTPQPPTHIIVLLTTHTTQHTALRCWHYIRQHPLPRHTTTHSTTLLTTHTPIHSTEVLTPDTPTHSTVVLAQTSRLRVARSACTQWLCSRNAIPCATSRRIRTMLSKDNLPAPPHMHKAKQ